MALVSPGVEVSIVDESNYVPAATSSVPYILIATAENKTSGTSTSIAPGTTAANAGKVYLVSSQRDLAATFGNPLFYKTSSGTPINGYELNEYGLQSAFSVLGISNRAYVQRANVDLSQLAASTARPTGAPSNGTYWLDTANTSWGIFQWNSSNSTFTAKTPIVITDSANLDSGVPKASIGAQGDYAVVTTNAKNPVYYKNTSNVWVLIGSDAWKNSWPTVQGTESVTSSLTATNAIIINGTSVQVPSAPNNTVSGLASAINTAAIAGITADVDSNDRLVLYGDSEATSDGSTAEGGIVNISGDSTAALLTSLGITATSYYTPELQQSYNYTVPRFRSGDPKPRPTGSIWNQLSNVNGGVNILLKEYSTALAAFTTVSVPVYITDQAANQALDPSGGGANITIGSIYCGYDVDPELSGSGLYNNTGTFRVYKRTSSGASTFTGASSSPTFSSGNTFSIQASVANSGTLTTAITATLGGTTAADFVAAVSAAGVANVSAEVSSSGAITLTHTQGGVIVLKNLSGTPVTDAGFSTSIDGVRAGTGSLTGALYMSAWETFTYTASATQPSQDPADGTYWFYSSTDQVDIMIQDGGKWKGYQNVTNDIRGFNLSTTNATGPIISTTEPTTQTDGTDLVYGDLWINTSDLENYPIINRWQSVNGGDQWVVIDNADQTTENGVLFTDARWDSTGTTDPITGEIPTIVSLLTSDYTDVDVASPTLYAEGTLLFNTRRSGYNVKSYQVGFFNASDYTFANYSSSTTYSAQDRVMYEGKLYIAIQTTLGNLPTDTTYWSLLQTATWTNASGNKPDGSPYMGRLAQRQIIVSAMKSAIDNQDALREEQNEFNLITCPNYPELLTNMSALNNERSNTAFIVGDTPMRLSPEGTEIIEWSTNNNGLGTASGDGLPTASAYMGTFYPSCQTTDITGSVIVMPPSHMMLRTLVRNDEIAYPWLAPAGTRRGVVDNADRLGYIDSNGEFVSINVSQGLRDTLYENKINPITFIPGAGIVNYGNKTESTDASALDRVNVARLVAFLRSRLNDIASTFVFEPNDQITRNEVSNAVSGLMIDLVAKRAIYDYLVVCDETNNTPARIDRNELYVDIAIEPVKAVEFIYIPVRIKNTGELASGQIAPSQGV